MQVQEVIKQYLIPNNHNNMIKDKRLLILLIFCLPLLTFVYYRATIEGIIFKDINIFSFHFVVLQYVVILIYSFIWQKSIILARCLGDLLILGSINLLCAIIIVGFEESIMNGVSACIYLILAFSPLYFYFLPIHLVMIYLQYRNISILSKYYRVFFYIMLLILCNASIGYYLALSDILPLVVPDV